MAEDNIEHGYLYKKIDSIEHRLESHVTKIEQRLDQLVHIMGAVASLQERETRNADSIKEIKSSLRDSFDKFEKAVERIHGRLDMINQSMDADVSTQASSSKQLEQKIEGVSNEVVKWRERAVGLWVGIGFLVVVVQVLGGFVLNSFNEEYKVTKSQVVEISKKQAEDHQEILLIKKNHFSSVPGP